MNKSVRGRFKERVEGIVDRFKQCVKRIIKYLSEVRAEFSKVVWPRRAEFLGSTVVVLFLMTVFAIYLGIVDFGVSKIISYLIFKISSF